LEASHFFRNLEYLSLELILFFVAEFAQIGLIFLAQMASRFSSLTYLSYEQFVKAKHVEACSLRFKHNRSSQFVCLFLHIFI